MFETVSTYKPRKATALSDDEIDQLHDALAGLAPGQAVTVSRATHDTESKARTDGLSIRKQYSAKYGVELRTHVLGDDGEYVGAVSNPIVKATDVKAPPTDDAPDIKAPTNVGRSRVGRLDGVPRFDGPGADGVTADALLRNEAESPKRNRKS